MFEIQTFEISQAAVASSQNDNATTQQNDEKIVYVPENSQNGQFVHRITIQEPCLVRKQLLCRFVVLDLGQLIVKVRVTFA